MINYKDQTTHDTKVKAFLSVFFGALQFNETDIFQHLKPNLFPGGYDPAGKEYLLLESEQHGVSRIISGSDQMVIFQNTDHILCISKLVGQDVYYGHRLIPLKEVSSEWLKSLTTLIAYAGHSRKNAVRDVLITHQYAGYRIVPVSQTILSEQFNHQLMRAKAIL